VVYPALIVGGVILGLAIGRWWALGAAASVGIWIALLSDVKVPGWFLGAAYALLAGAGIAGGVLARKALAHASS
jgi:hypothetical protein